jgi:phage terminase large subunit-like protein
MPTRKQEELSLDDVLLLTEQSLRRASVSPGLSAYKPHALQEKLHRSPAKEKLFIGGNRSGKSVFGAVETVMWLTGLHPYRKDIPLPPVRGRAVAVDIEEGIKKISHPEIRRWLPASFLVNGSWEDSYDKLARTLTLTNGSFLEFMSYEQDVGKFAGTSRHFTWFDEEPPEDIFNECLMRLVDTDGSYWITMTPLIELTWVKDKIYDPWAEGDHSIFVLEIDTTENPHIKIEALDRITRGLSAEEKEARRSGKFITHTGLVYAGSYKAQSSDEGGNVVEDLLDDDFEIYRRQWQHFVCMDHGFANPTVFLFCCFDADGRIIVYDELYEVQNIVRENAALYRSRIRDLKVTPVYVVGDPSIQNTSAITRTSIQTEYVEHGVPIALGNNDVRGGIARVQNRFSKRLLFVSRRCQHTLRELNNYRWDRYASTKIEVRRNKKETPLKRNDHCMDALRYGVMSRPAFQHEIDEAPGNVLNLPEAGEMDFDYELMFSAQNGFNKNFDEQLGIEW